MTQIGAFLPTVTVGNTAVDIRGREAKAIEWLEKQTPRTVSDGLKGLAKKHRISFKAMSRTEFPKHGGFRKVVNGCVVGGKIENAAALAEDVEFLMTPMKSDDRSDLDRIEGWLAELHGICAARGNDEIGHRVSLAGYAKRLRDYPVDVVRYVLLEKTWKWFPDWHDMKLEADALMSERKVLVESLRTAEPAKPAKPELTAEERAAWVEKVNADIRAKAEQDHPDVQEDMKAKAVLKEAADHMRAALAEN